jgi:hypothetical protein
MAETWPNPKNGAVVLSSSYSADFNSYELVESQATESVAAYGAAVYDPYRGSGTPHLSATVGAFAKYGAATKTPGFGAFTADYNGDSATFTIDTQQTVTLAGVMVCSSIRLGHGRTRAAVPLTFNLECGGDITTTWPTS